MPKLFFPKGGGAAPFDIFAKFLLMFPWESIDGFGSYIDAGASITPYGGHLRFRTGATNGNEADFYNAQDLNLSFDKNFTIEWIIQGVTDLTTCTFGFLAGIDQTMPIDWTTKRVGFIARNGALYGLSADGTTESETDLVTTIAAGQRLKLVFTAGASAKFYVNDVLKATKTTNLPAGAGDLDHLPIHAITAADADRGFTLGRLLFQADL